MRCAFESRQEQLTIYPFPGLKVINIRGSNLLALDLITIGSFVSRLSDNNRLLELSMRDYPLDETGLRGLLPCLPLVRTVTLCARRLRDPINYSMIGKNKNFWYAHSRAVRTWWQGVAAATSILEKLTLVCHSLPHVTNISKMCINLIH